MEMETLSKRFNVVRVGLVKGDLHGHTHNRNGHETMQQYVLQLHCDMKMSSLHRST